MLQKVVADSFRGHVERLLVEVKSKMETKWMAICIIPVEDKWSVWFIAQNAVVCTLTKQEITGFMMGIGPFYII